MKPTQTYTLKVSLRNAEPSHWRRFVLPASTPLATLALALDIVLGWGEPEPHWFESAGRILYYRVNDRNRSNRNVALRRIIVRVGDQLEYHRGFAEVWEHDLRLESISSSLDHQGAACLAGAGATASAGRSGVMACCYPKIGKFNAIVVPPFTRREMLKSTPGPSFDLNAVNRSLKYLFHATALADGKI